MSSVGVKDKISILAEQSQELVETAYKIAVLEATDQVTKLTSTIVTMSGLLLLFNFLLLFLGFGVAHWIGDSLGDLKMGYFIVGGFYLLLIIVIVLLSKKVIVPYFRNFLVKKLYE